MDYETVLQSDDPGHAGRQTRIVAEAHCHYKLITK